jgi:hypothetical protein
MSQRATRPREREQQEQASETVSTSRSSRSAPRDFPASGRGRHSHNRHGYATSPSEAPVGPPRHSSGSYDSSSRQQHHQGPRSSAQSYGSSPSGESGGFRRNSSGGRSSTRYGQWPPPGSSPAETGGLPRSGSSGRSTGRHGSGVLRPSPSSGQSAGRTFNWPVHMDRPQLQQAMKRGQVFRCVMWSREGSGMNLIMPACAANLWPRLPTYPAAQPTAAASVWPTFGMPWRVACMKVRQACRSLSPVQCCITVLAAIQCWPATDMHPAAAVLQMHDNAVHCL